MLDHDDELPPDDSPAFSNGTAALLLATVFFVMAMVGIASVSLASEPDALAIARAEALDPTPIRWLEAQRLAHPERFPVIEHGGQEPTWNDPTIQDACFTGSFEHDTWCGAEWILPPYYAQPYEYGFTNNVTGGNPATNDCGISDAYASAGQIGNNCLFTLRLIGGDLEATPLAEGYVFWAASWEDAWYSPLGWTVIDVDTFYVTWWTGSSEWNELLDGSGNWIGWQRFYTNPSDTELVGVSVYHWGAIDYDGDAEIDNGADIWRVTFTNQ